jgi:hypothetical protein
VEKSPKPDSRFLNDNIPPGSSGFIPLEPGGFSFLDPAIMSGRTIRQLV